MKHKNKKSVVRKAGRPAATINYPNRKFTFTELAAENKHVTPLCLRLTLKRDAALGKKSLIVKLEGEKRDNPSGKGRMLEVYQKRARQNIGSNKPAKTPKTVKTVTVPVVAVNTPAETAPVAETVAPTAAPLSADYEAQKAELLGTPAAPVAA